MDSVWSICDDSQELFGFKDMEEESQETGKNGGGGNWIVIVARC